MNLQDIKNLLEDELFLKINFNYKRIYCASENKHIFKELKNKYNQFCYSELIYLIKHKNELEKLHIFCPICGKKNPFINLNNGYHFHCSQKCTQNDKEVRRKRIEKCHELRGNDVNNKKKRQHTLFLKTGNPYYRNHEKHRQTSLNNIDKNGNNSYQRQAIHFKETMLNSIDENGMNGFDRVHQKTVEKRLLDIDENGKNSYQRGAAKGLQTAKNNIDENGNNSLQRAEQKRRKYFQETKGVDNFAQTQEYKDLFLDEEWVNKRQIKIYQTNKERGNYGRRSKMEKLCFAKVKEKFQNAEHSYYDEKRYPFNCDMYIPELDLFIECHFGFAHGGEPFDPNNPKHIEKLNLWKLKAEEINFKGQKKKSYLNAIYQWTKLDVKKLKTFKDNKLNYKIFYTEKEFDKWLETVDSFKYI